MLRRIQRRMQVIGASDGMKYVELLRDKGAGDTIRIWTAGCSSGEEPYSIAILLAEALARLRARPTIQISRPISTNRCCNKRAPPATGTAR